MHLFKPRINRRWLFNFSVYIERRNLKFFRWKTFDTIITVNLNENKNFIILPIDEKSAWRWRNMIAMFRVIQCHYLQV